MNLNPSFVNTGYSIWICVTIDVTLLWLGFFTIFPSKVHDYHVLLVVCQGGIFALGMVNSIGYAKIN
jgi:hypothetical protein